MGRAPCCDKANVKRGPWSPEEDAILKDYIEKNGTGGNWIALPQKIGLKRCGKSCRLRWLNYLRPNIIHGGFTEEEDNIICSLYMNIGSRWSIIASQLPGRTDNDIKNYWNTKLKKKLLGKQRKEQTKRANYLKQEVKSEAQDVMFPAVVNQTPYWPEMPVTMPMMSVNQVYPQPDHQDPEFLKNLFIKQEGNLQYSMDAFPVQDQAYPNSLNMVSSSTSASMFGTSVPQFPADMFQELENFPGAIYGNQDQLDGLESLYGMDVMSGSSTAGTSSAASGESSSWGADINSFVYPPMVSNYEGGEDGVPQDSTFQENQLRYFGTQ